MIKLFVWVTQMKPYRACFFSWYSNQSVSNKPISFSKTC